MVCALACPSNIQISLLQCALPLQYKAVQKHQLRFRITLLMGLQIATPPLGMHLNRSERTALAADRILGSNQSWHLQTPNVKTAGYPKDTPPAPTYTRPNVLEALSFLDEQKIGHERLGRFDCGTSLEECPPCCFLCIWRNGRWGWIFWGGGWSECHCFNSLQTLLLNVLE